MDVWRHQERFRRERGPVVDFTQSEVHVRMVKKIRASASPSVFTKAALALFFAAVLGFFPAPTPAAEKGARAQGDRDEINFQEEPSDDDGRLLDNALDLVESAQEYWVKGDEDKSIEALDQAYASILEVNTDANPKLDQSKEDLRLTISKRLMEIYASRHIAAKGNHRAIPLTMNKYVEREIKLFRGRERWFFMESYRRSGKYRNEIVQAFRDAGLPEELSWLPLIESGFKLRAQSPARALGLWQFIPSTGYKYGLRRNKWIDERLDPVKSTNAAILYLTDLHEIFGDWATVLAAYNCGEGTVLRAISRQKKDYLDGFWDLYERLPYETARYFPRFLAVLAILKDPARYGFTLEEPDSPTSYEEITVKRSLSLRTIAKNLGMSGRDLADLNPELRRYATPAAPYSLKVPTGKGVIVLAGLKALPRLSSPRSGYVYHRVRRGETLSFIARRYHTSMHAIIEANDIRHGNYIRAGQKLKIPLDDIT